MTKDYKQTWRQRSRKILADAFGGKCTICGYDKCIDAFDYHHLDPTQKDDLLSSKMKNGGRWSDIVIEARKCTILCSRCHREIHAGVVILPDNPARFNEEYAESRNRKKARVVCKDACPICGKLKSSTQKTCSLVCMGKRQSKVDWTHVDFYELRVVNKMTYVDIGKLLGVSDRIVSKMEKLFRISKK